MVRRFIWYFNNMWKREVSKVFERDTKKARISTGIKSNLQIFESGKLKAASEPTHEYEGHSNPIL